MTVGGSAPPRALIEERALACGAVLVLEPSADGGALKTGRKGVGTFEVVDGRITVWRDRFDWVTVVVAVLAAVPRAILARFGGAGPAG